MTALCHELRITSALEDKEKVVETLHRLGIHDFVEGSVDCDLFYDHDAPEFKDGTFYEVHAGNSPITLYGEDPKALQDIAARLGDSLTQMGVANVTFTLGVLADQDWKESWKASFKPIDIEGTFVILPPWEKPEDHPQPHKIIIDPGMAFGTGQHETTRLCLTLFVNDVGMPPPQRVFDVGTGSGILAIAAQLAGSREILGCDIDPDSVSIAIANAHANGANGISFVDTPIERINQHNFDLVFANIQFAPLCRLMPHIVERTTPGGQIIISGILATEQEEFVPHLTVHGLTLQKSLTMGDWTGFLCRRS